jgi:hypothetical protein
MCSSETFASRLNRILDRFDFPENTVERQHAFGEYFDITQQKAQMILSGSVIPKKSLMGRIADDLLIDTDALLA